jgi:hypothetical protein
MIGAMDSPKRLVDAVRQLVDGALDRVFHEPLDVRNADDVRRAVTTGPGTGNATMRRLSAFAAAASPAVERLVRMARRTTRVASKGPSPQAKIARYAVAAVPVGAQLVSAARLGTRELQALASYAMFRMREAGVEPERELVRRVAVTLYLDPTRRPDLQLSGARATGAIARRWVMRAIAPDTEAALTERIAAQTAALERIDFTALATPGRYRRGEADQNVTGSLSGPRRTVPM